MSGAFASTKFHNYYFFGWELFFNGEFQIWKWTWNFNIDLLIFNTSTLLLVRFFPIVEMSWWKHSPYSSLISPKFSRKISTIYVIAGFFGFQNYVARKRNLLQTIFSLPHKILSNFSTLNRSLICSPMKKTSLICALFNLEHF